MWLRLNNEQKRLAAEIAAKRFSFFMVIPEAGKEKNDVEV